MLLAFCLGDVYDCRVALRLWGEEKGRPGVIPEHPLWPQRSKWGQILLTISRPRNWAKLSLLISQTSWNPPNHLMKKYNSQNSLGLGKRIFGRETLPHKLPHFPTLGSWYSKYRSGQEHRKMSLSCHPPPPQYEDCSFQSSIFWMSPLLPASSPLPLLPLLPRQRSRRPGGGREGCWEVGTASPGPNRRLEQQFQARREAVASSHPREQSPGLGSQRMGQR